MLKQKTGLDSYGIHMTWQPEDLASVSTTTSQMIQDLFEHSLEESAASSLLGIYETYRTFAESIPLRPRVKLSLAQRPYVLPADIGHDLSIENNLDLVFSDDDKHLAGQPDQSVQITLPGVHGRAFDVQQNSPTSKTTPCVQVRLYGTPPKDVTMRNTNVNIQISHILRIIHGMLNSLQSTKSYSRFKTLTEDVASALVDRRFEFGTFINLQCLRVSAGFSKSSGQRIKAVSERAAPWRSVEEDKVPGDSSRLDLPETKLSEMKSTDAECPEMKPLQTKLSETEPAETGPSETGPSETGPSKTGPPGIDTLETGTSEIQTSETNPSETELLQQEPSKFDNRKDKVFIALGSNLGDRLANIEAACRAMDAESDIRVARTSGLYETEAMYVTDQNRFLNGVCEV